jgi:ATP-dependent DNA helicase DinG
MTGIDVVGDALSLVVLCKFPLPRFDVVCRKQIDHWRKRGYPNFYEKEALTVFSQASGRLIRSNGDHGVVAILDQRVTKSTEKVSQTAQIGVRALGSDVIRSTEDVRNFLASRG